MVEALIIVFVLVNFILLPCVVDGSSMVATLNDGDFGYSFIVTRNLKISRFDIAVIRTDSENKKLLVKRVIGLPGDTIEYRDNMLYVNGEYLEEPYLKDVSTGDFKVTLKEDEYYCLGDNRNVSRDSRYYGAFSQEQIVSTHLLVLYPFKDFGYKS